MKFITVIILLFSLQALQAQSSKEEAVWQRVELLNKSVFGSKDSVVMKDLVSSRLSYGHSGGNLEDKATMVTKASLSPTVYKSPTTERISILFEKKTAIVRQIFRAISVEKGLETPLNLAILQVWAKEGGKWKLLARQAVKILPK